MRIHTHAESGRRGRDSVNRVTKVIRVSAVVLRDEAGRILLVRKRGTSKFMQPGGKPELGESPDQTAIREVREELGLELDPALLRPLGTFTTAAANEPGHLVEGTCFTHPLLGEPVIAAEIEELRWFDPSAPHPDDLAPLFEHHILPALGH